jgi:hypothetical protein
MDENEKFSESLKDMGVNIDQASGATQELVKILGALNKVSKEEQAAKEAEAKIVKKLEERADKLREGWGGLLTAGVALVASLNSATSSIYGSDKAFTSLIPTLDAFTSTTKAIVTAFGDLASGASVAGFSFGKASEGAAKLINVGVDIVANAAKFQLETAQKVADTYTEAAKAGANFATGIQSLANDARHAGLPMQMYTKILTTNIEAIGKFGIGVTNGAMKLADLASDIGRGDRKLLAMYGGFEGLSQGIAQYMELQTQLGVDNKVSSKEQIAGAAEYLRRQRELSDITGKNAEALKKEEQERRNKLDYALKLAELGKDQQDNVQEAMEVIGKTMSSRAAKYAEEYFATGGQVISKANLEWAATNAEAARAAERVIGEIDKSRSAFRDGYGKVLAESQPALAEAAKSNRELSTINRAANNEILAGMAETSSAIIANGNVMKSVGSQTAEMEGKRNEQMDAATAGYANAIERLTQSQMKIDASVVNNMTKMGTLVDFLYDQQQKIIDAQDKVINVINAITSGSFTDFKNALGDLTKFMMGRMVDMAGQEENRTGDISYIAPEAGQTYEVPTAPTASDMENAQNLVQQALARRNASNKAGATDNKRAGEGIAYGPTLTGEDGPEAHIKLRNNSIPLDINLDPLISAMRDQAELQKEMIRELRDTRDVQERILNATY